MRIHSITKSASLLFVIFLSACATPNSERVYSSTKTSILRSNDKFHTCLKNITKKDEYKNLINKITSSKISKETSEPNSESIISKEDNILLRGLYEEHKTCNINKLEDYKKIDKELYRLGIQQLKTRENYFSDWLKYPETTYDRISEDSEYLIKRENQQNSLWAEYYTNGVKRQRAIEMENRARIAEELSADIESFAGAFIDALIFMGNSQPTTTPVQPSATLVTPVQPSATLVTPVQPSSTARTTGSQCPTGSHPWSDQWGNRICKDSMTGATTTISGTLESCPPGTFRWVDSFGTPICKSSTSSEEYYDTSKGCPFGTYLSTSEWGKPACKKL